MTLNEYATRAHEYAVRQGFWKTPRLDIQSKEWNPFTLSKLMLIVTEVAEAAEAVRHGDVANLGEELADALIRIFDLARAVDIDLDEAVEKKMRINEDRPHMHGKLS